MRAMRPVFKTPGRRPLPTEPCGFVCRGFPLPRRGPFCRGPALRAAASINCAKHRPPSLLPVPKPQIESCPPSSSAGHFLPALSRLSQPRSAAPIFITAIITPIFSPNGHPFARFFISIFRHGLTIIPQYNIIEIWKIPVSKICCLGGCLCTKNGFRSSVR